MNTIFSRVNRNIIPDFKIRNSINKFCIEKVIALFIYLKSPSDVLISLSSTSSLPSKLNSRILSCLSLNIEDKKIFCFFNNFVFSSSNFCNFLLFIIRIFSFSSFISFSNSSNFVANFIFFKEYERI